LPLPGQQDEGSPGRYPLVSLLGLDQRHIVPGRARMSTWWTADQELVEAAGEGWRSTACGSRFALVATKPCCVQRGSGFGFSP